MPLKKAPAKVRTKFITPPFILLIVFFGFRLFWVIATMQNISDYYDMVSFDNTVKTLYFSMGFFISRIKRKIFINDMD